MIPNVVNHLFFTAVFKQIGK